MVCMLNVLAVAGLGGFLWATGRLDQPKVQAIADMLKHQLDGMPIDLADKYRTAMESDRAAKIIGEFKTPEEKGFMKGLLDRIQNGSKESGTSSASATAGATGVALTAAGANAPSPPA